MLTQLKIIVTFAAEIFKSTTNEKDTTTSLANGRFLWNER